MKKLTKLVIFVLFAAICLASLASCHGKKVDRDTDLATNYSGAITDFEVPEEFDTSREYEISFWAKSDSNATQTAIYRKAIADFEALYPNIKVNYVPYYDYGRIYNDVITNISTGTTPNVCITYPDHIATYITGDNTVVALDELFDNEKYGLGGRQRYT